MDNQLDQVIGEDADILLDADSEFVEERVEHLKESGLFSGDTKRGLEVLRRKLLALNRRNALLNYRHPKASLRIIDELPDFLFKQLLDGRSFKILPIKRPDLDSLSEEERDHLARLKGRDRTLFIAKNIWKMDTSYDLPEPQAGADPRRQHADAYIQTLHMPEELEGIMRGISRAARLAIEETGSNFLHLAFGFLEWFESESSNKENYAPLILVPVEVSRHLSQNGNYLYELSYTGEDLMPNLSLVEWLKEKRGLHLPELDPEKGPRQFWKECIRVIQQEPRWKIRQWATLGLFQFRKLLIFHDLDPDKWANTDRLENNPLVKMFFEGTIESEPRQLRDDYDVDDHPKVDLPLIEDADSTQHSALIDALEGKNMVIEGPPGTGKSQTITNLIATAMAEGKTVLFVSEKLAALKVVKERLDRNGLGDFCLELHSEKTKKQQLFHDISKRLDRHFPRPHDLTTRLAELKDQRRKLGILVNALERKHEGLGLTNQEILTTAARSRLKAERAMTAHREDLDALTHPQPLQFPIEDMRRLDHILQDFAAFSEDVAPGGGNPAETPWFGVADSDEHAEEHQILHDLKQLEMHCREVMAAQMAVNEHYGIRLSDEFGLLDQLSKLVEAIDARTPHLWFSVLNAMSRHGSEIRTFRDSLIELQTKNSHLERFVGGSFNLRTHGESLVKVADLVAELIVSNKVTLSELSALRDSCIETASQIAQIADLMNQLGAPFKSSIPPTKIGIERATQIISCCRQAPFDDLHHRAERLTHLNIRPLLESGEKIQAELFNEYSYLSREFHWELISHDKEQIIEVVQALSTTGFFSFLSPKWRRARSFYRTIWTDKKSKLDPTKACADLNRLLAYFKRSDELTVNNHFSEQLGEQFQGVSTDFSALRRVSDWLQVIMEVFPGNAHGEVSDSISHILETDVQTIRNIAHLSDEESIHFLTEIEEFLLRPPPLSNEVLSKPQTWLELHTSLLRVGNNLTHTIGVLEEMGLPGDFNIEMLSRSANQVSELLSLIHALDHSKLDKIIGAEFVGSRTSHDSLNNAIALYDDISKGVAPPEMSTKLTSCANIEKLQTELAPLRRIHAGLHNLSHALEAFEKSGATDLRTWARGELTAVSVIFGAIERSLAAQESLVPHLRFARQLRICRNEGLGRIVDLVFNKKLSASKMTAVFNYCILNPLAKELQRQYPPLADSGIQLNRLRRDFAETDKKAQKLLRAELAHKISQRGLPPGINSPRAAERTEMALIEHQIGLDRHSVTIRNLCSRAGNALIAMKPCFMMGPLAVAQFLQRGTLKFDIVIMDEASQMRPEDSLGAIARGKQIVIVGDPKQLPPTTFFDRMQLGDGDGDNAELTILHTSESILDAASGLLHPTRQLKWHYRSKHENLIAFSNAEFYRNLVVFPSPHGDHPDYGVKFHHIHGIYHGSKNEEEAKEVAKAILEHYRSHSSESLGVVAMNIQQSNLIQEVFDDMLKDDPEVQEILEKLPENVEKLFIKNLENVQGDERDVIIISATYGPDDAGVIRNHFGPINFGTGWRRLNVLFTRARKRIHLFSSMTHEDIQLDATASRGAQALRNYLRFAKEGRLSSEKESGRPPGSAFEQEVADRLAEKGYVTEPQLGVARYYIDLAVRHPKKPGRYILGIECDGATYHSCKSARDRDRLRQEVLENMGWEIHRVWSTDWFSNPHHEINLILQKLDQLRQNETQAVTPIVPHEDNTVVQVNEETPTSSTDRGGESEGRLLSSETDEGSHEANINFIKSHAPQTWFKAAKWAKEHRYLEPRCRRLLYLIGQGLTEGWSFSQYQASEAVISLKQLRSASCS